MRLFLIGLPLTMVFGALAGFLIFPDIGVWVVVLMALILSPTDAALGQAVVINPAIPERTRRAINVESGLNDGMALPPILVCIAALSEAAYVEIKMNMEGPPHLPGLIVLDNKGMYGGVLTIDDFMKELRGLYRDACDKPGKKDWMDNFFNQCELVGIKKVSEIMSGKRLSDRSKRSNREIM